MSNTMGQVSAEKLKFLIAIGETSLRRQVVALVRTRFSNAVIYEAKDGAEALQKLESDRPHILVLGGQLARRSPQQILTSLYQFSPPQELRSIVLGAVEDTAEIQDLVATGVVQLAPLNSDFGPFLVAVYKAVNSLRSSEADFKMRYLQGGEILLREGEKGERLYLLMKGRLTAFLGDSAAPKVLGSVTPGEFVGEMAYINREPRVATVRAEEDSELVEFEIETFDQILYRKPSWMKALLQTLSRRVKVLNARKAST